MRDDKGSGIPAPNTTKTSGAVEKVHADKVLFYSLSNSKTMSVTQKGSADPDNQERDQRNQGSWQDMGKDNRNYSKNLIDDEDDEEEEDAIAEDDEEEEDAIALELDDDMDEEEGSLNDPEDMTVEFEDADIDEEDDFIEEGEDMVIEANDKEELANILLDDDEDEDDEDLLDEDHQGGTA